MTADDLVFLQACFAQSQRAVLRIGENLRLSWWMDGICARRGRKFPKMRMPVVFVPALLHDRDVMCIYVYTYRGYIFHLVAMTIPCMLLALHPNSERHLGDILACAAAVMRIGGCLPICTECQLAIDSGGWYGGNTHCDCWLLDGLVSHRLKIQSQAKIANPIFNLRLWVRGFAPS